MDEMGEMGEMGEDGAEWKRIERMSAAELRRELAEQGIDPDAEIEAMRRLGRVMAAKYAPRIERERLMLRGAAKAFPVCADAAAAGPPAWASGDAPEGRASLLDVLAGAAAADTAWARVSGWSMRGEGVNDGDMVLVNFKREPKDGDVVLAHLAGRGQVVKRLSVVGGKARLLSAHPDFPPMEIDDESGLTIHGVVVGRAGTL